MMITGSKEPRGNLKGAGTFQLVIRRLFFKHIIIHTIRSTCERKNETKQNVSKIKQCALKHCSNRINKTIMKLRQV